MPTTPAEWKEFGFYGLAICAGFILLFKAVPAMVGILRQWVEDQKAARAELIATFRQEIQRERDLGQTMLREERERHQAAWTTNNKIVAELTAAVRNLGDQVRDMRTGGG